MRLVDAKYDEMSGESYAIVEHRGKCYVGMAWLHTDEEYSSKFTGCRYAEIRAEIKALKDERRDLIAACEACRKFVKACGQYKNWDKNSIVAKVVYKQLNKRIKEVNKLTDKINNLNWDLNIAIKQQDMVHNKLTGKRVNMAIIDESLPEEAKAEIDNLS